jgi:hypothetical protein
MQQLMRLEILDNEEISETFLKQFASSADASDLIWQIIIRKFSIQPDMVYFSLSPPNIIVSIVISIS